MTKQEESSESCYAVNSTSLNVPQPVVIRGPQQDLEEEKEHDVPARGLANDSQAATGMIEDDAEANEREIQRILQEEMAQMDALAYQNQ